MGSPVRVNLHHLFNRIVWRAFGACTMATATTLMVLAGCRGSERAAAAGPASSEDVAHVPNSLPTPAQPTAPTPISPSRVVALSPSLRVDMDRHEVQVDGTLCLDAGYLEQVACMKGTREHESLIVPDAKPSAIHAALLLAGFTPGRPGSWQFDAHGTLSSEPPTGDEVEVLLRIGDSAPRPVRDFIRNGQTGDAFPVGNFIFAGSLVRENPPSLGPGTHYLADWSGSVVGVVTFGDEVIAWREVIPDSADASAPVWITRSSELPPPGTRATLMLRRAAKAAGE